jgi:opacity protein-like surface antigen
VVRPAPTRPVAVLPPPRPSRTVVTRTTAPVVVAQPRRIYRPRPTHGVFVYGARPVHHHHYVAQNNQPAATAPATAHLPKRKVDRARSLSVGLTTGSYVTGYKGGSAFGDFGLGLQTRYRPMEAFGIELAAAHYNESFGPDTERARTNGSLSAMVFVTPWATLSPYALAGLSLTGVHHDSNLPLGVDPVDGGAKALHFGPHGGLGLQINLGQRFSLDIDGRVMGYVTRGEDRVSPPAAFTGNLGVSAYF